MAFYKDERLALFIDGASLFATSKALDMEVDFRKLLTEFRSKGRLLRANYYTAILEDDDYSPLRPLVDWLSYNGYNVIKKPAREFTDREGKRRVRSSMSVEIAVDMLETAAHVDHIIFFAGDGDFRRLVEKVKSEGCRVTVVSSVKGQSATISDDLRREADVFIDLEDLADLVSRPRRVGEPSKHLAETDHD
ncbi:LabA-like NYN domain-containing protein [Henriciella litoralis]|uniref:LabA-like NYN domain-containing protein n=1 Tax=Henriciella litoralis TaxID=568102 RepID=UPI000A069D82|nr:NYN domain-containing protein [Henriciella litoralis]